MKIAISFFWAFLYLIPSNILGQNLVVEYDIKNFDAAYTVKMVLNDSASVFTSYQPSGQATNDNSNNLFVVKKYAEDVILCSDELFGKTFYVKDTLNAMQWKLTDEAKVILEEQCLSATTNFRGRTYKAFYSKSMLYNDGPWKFGGLPGLILEVKSDDGKLAYTANKIVRNSPDRISTLKYDRLKYISWPVFVEEFYTTIEKYIQLVKTNGALEDGATMNLKIEGAELSYPR